MPSVCCSVMVLKKLGDELMPDFHSVVEYLGKEQGMQVVVEPHEHAKMVHRLYILAMQAGLCLAFACTGYLIVGVVSCHQCPAVTHQGCGACVLQAFALVNSAFVLHLHMHKVT